jgi:hypothetical protein
VPIFEIKRRKHVLSLDSAAAFEVVENARVSLDVAHACSARFADWLRSHDDIDKSAISRRRLLALYAEFCEFYDLRPLTQGRFDRSLKQAGFQRRRLSTGRRPWVYFLHDAHIREKMKRCTAPGIASARTGGLRHG